ncbi:hypothetical protein SAMN05216556_10953 [Aequorivita viscosa]|nr:hypothetical protein SAMN05216556_10953 [Aequorivita viscosa]
MPQKLVPAAFIFEIHSGFYFTIIFVVLTAPPLFLN